MHEIRRMSMSIKGVILGVGFRPFVYNLARLLDLKGWVRSTIPPGAWSWKWKATKRLSSPVAGEVAPCNHYLGVMLPYTPMHHLLFANDPEALVMTSGNSSGEGIEYLDNEALANLGSLVDYFLTSAAPPDKGT